MRDRPHDASLAPLEYGPVIRAGTAAWDTLTMDHGVLVIGGTGRAVAASAGGGTPARTGIGIRPLSILTQTRILRPTWRPGFGIGAISIKIIIPMLAFAPQGGRLSNPNDRSSGCRTAPRCLRRPFAVAEQLAHKLT